MITFALATTVALFDAVNKRSFGPIE